jgi:hypothetical protein
MRFNLARSYLLILCLTPVLALAGNIQQHEKDFNFEWNNYQTISASQANLAASVDFVKSISDTAALSPADKNSLGKLHYKLGTFYTHVLKDPNTAIQQLISAGTLLSNKMDKAWDQVQLAYAYETKFAANNAPADKKTALAYTDKVIADFANTPNKVVAFAYCVKGLVANDAKNYSQAESAYKTALGIYDKIPGPKDTQYVLAKNRLATIILSQPGREQEALTMLKQLRIYWLTTGSVSMNPYAARNFINLSQAYAKTGNFDAERGPLKEAITIYKNIYGKTSPLLAPLYQQLADNLKKTGNRDRALYYQDKARALTAPAS